MSRYYHQSKLSFLLYGTTLVASFWRTSLWMWFIRGLELVTSPSSGHETSSKKFLCYILSDQVWWCNVRLYLSYSRNYFCKFMQFISWHHKLFHFHFYSSILNYSTCPFKFGKCGKEGEISQKFEYFENEKSFLDQIKNIFHSF